MNDLKLDTRLVAPLPQDMWGVACSHCDKPQSRWTMREVTEGKEEEKILCSLCFLYDSIWGQNQRKALDEYITEIETIRSDEQKAAAPPSEAPYILPFRYAKTPDGRLSYATDGDRVLGYIALASRTVQLRSRVVHPEP